MTEYTTREGDTLDYICFRFYGDSKAYAEAVRESNPQLSDVGPVLPTGITITLPHLNDITVQQQSIRLWD